MEGVWDVLANTQAGGTSDGRSATKWGVCDPQSRKEAINCDRAKEAHAANIENSGKLLRMLSTCGGRCRNLKKPKTPKI